MCDVGKNEIVWRDVEDFRRYCAVLGRVELQWLCCESSPPHGDEVADEYMANALALALGVG